MTICRRSLSISIRQWLGGTALLLCGLQPALADDAAPQDTSSSGEQSKADPAKAKLLGNITVTAQSRSQEVQSMPTSRPSRATSYAASPPATLAWVPSRR